jgi:hypothetical protein
MNFKNNIRAGLIFLSCYTLNGMHHDCYNAHQEYEKKVQEYQTKYENSLNIINQQQPHNTFWKTQAQKEFEKMKTSAYRAYVACLSSKWNVQ